MWLLSAIIPDNRHIQQHLRWDRAQTTFHVAAGFDSAAAASGRHSGRPTAYSGTSRALSVAAGRVSYLFNLRGLSVALDTACSSSLVTLHMAASRLARGQLGAALNVGVNAILLPDTGAMFQRAGMLSSDGRCKVTRNAEPRTRDIQGVCPVSAHTAKMGVPTREVLYNRAIQLGLIQMGRGPVTLCPSTRL